MYDFKLHRGASIIRNKFLITIIRHESKIEKIKIILQRTFPTG